ncbi:hypothetical protein HOD29_01240 [archaeon]|jgi:hypothetical protein|nr:hypothetical protein [Candidatus Woesearchaeota archaeon]MBT4375978.1 hypothetical protein [archaeon]
MKWIDVCRPGVFSFDKSKIFAEYDEKYGEDNWRIVHRYGRRKINFKETCKLFEEAYYLDSFNRGIIWEGLQRQAKDVYDLDKIDVLSGLNYLVQNNVATHIQDIAIRNVFKRRGWEFMGRELVQIRGNAGFFGKRLSPYNVMFHEPENIIQPSLEGKWLKNSVEDFYQSNKYLQWGV